MYIFILIEISHLLYIFFYVRNTVLGFTVAFVNSIVCLATENDQTLVDYIQRGRVQRRSTHRTDNLLNLIISLSSHHHVACITFHYRLLTLN